MSVPLKCTEVIQQEHKNGTIAVSSRAMSRVPVTRRKMMKMLMILSRDRSNHTTIYTHKEDTHRKKEKKGEGDREKRQVSTILKRWKTYSDQTHGETCVLPMRRGHFGSKSCPLGS